MQSEDGKKQQARVMDLLPIAHQLDCTVAQLAIGETLQGPASPRDFLHLSLEERVPGQDPLQTLLDSECPR